jgi:hypothetical protein
MWINSLLWSFGYVKISHELSAEADASQEGSMDDHDVISQAESDEEILTFDVSDEALERTASTERQAYTWIYCTGAWQYCPA